MIELAPDEARRLRARAQLIGGSGLDPAAVVRRAIAFQGQDLPAVLRAIALRCAPGTTVEDVRAAFDNGELVRGWPMRATLFAMTPRDLGALAALTAGRIHASTALRRTQLELDEGTIARAREVALAELAEAELSRAELLAAWEAAGIATAGQRGYHLIFHLSVGGLMHWGRFAGAEQLLRLTPPAVPEAPEETLARIARGYLAARGPATLDDLAWWIKLPKGSVAPAVGAVEEAEEVRVDGRAMWLIDDGVGGEPPAVLLLPGFDEWILGYQDRGLVASDAAFQALVPGGNGVFRPAVLVDGRVVGTWRLAPAKRGVREPVLELVESVTARQRRAIDAALAAWPLG